MRVVASSTAERTPTGRVADQAVQVVQSLGSYFPLRYPVRTLGPRAPVLGLVDLGIDRLLQKQTVIPGQPENDLRC